MKKCCSSWPVEEKIRIGVTAASWLVFGSWGAMQSAYGNNEKAAVCLLAGLAVHVMQSVQANAYRVSRLTTLNSQPKKDPHSACLHADHVGVG